jgi:hypothetical protein
VRWFNREALALLLQCLEAAEAAESAQKQAPKKRAAKKPLATQSRLLQMAEECGYRWEPFLALIATE